MVKGDTTTPYYGIVVTAAVASTVPGQNVSGSRRGAPAPAVAWRSSSALAAHSGFPRGSIGRRHATCGG